MKVNLNLGEKALENVSNMFNDMMVESRIEATYRMFNARSYRDTLQISTAIWMELEPIIKDRINEIRKKHNEK